MCCFALSLGQVAGFLPLGAIDYADRYSYIPSVFIWIVVGLLITRNRVAGKISGEWQKIDIRRSIFIVAALLYISCPGIIGLVYSNTWRDYYSVLIAARTHEPPSYIALGALGDIELSKGNYPEAIKLADRIITRKKGLETQKGYEKIILKARYIKAVAMYKLDRKKEALEIFDGIKQVLNVNSFETAEGYYAVIKMMVDCCNSTGDREKADKLKSEMNKYRRTCLVTLTTDKSSLVVGKHLRALVELLEKIIL